MSHTSPNNAEEGSYVYIAEEWMLAQGFVIPEEHEYPHLFQAMLDEASDKGE